MEPATHQAIDRRLCGEPQELRSGFARVTLRTTAEMRVDEHGLVHGGFVFGLIDHAAMLAVNHPHVVLGGAGVQFLEPVVVGDELTAEALLHDQQGRKKIVTVDVHRGTQLVARSELTCFALERHVLEGHS